MIVKLPSGKEVEMEGIPDNATDAQIKAEFIRSGLATEEDFIVANTPPKSPIDDAITKGNEAVFLSSEQQAPIYQPTMKDKVIGAAETTASTLSGLTSGGVGYIGGLLGGIPAMAQSGLYGTQQGNELLNRSALEGAEKLTYVPRTQEGQRQTQALGGLLSNVAGIAPLSEFSAMTANMPNIGNPVRPSIDARTGGSNGRNLFNASVDDVLSAGKREGVNIQTTDIFPPKTFIGKTVQALGERVPFVGTGESKVVQYQQRVDALANMLDEYGATNASDASALVMTDILNKRSNALNQFSQVKNNVLNNVDSKTRESGIKVTMDNTNKAIDTQIASLSENATNPLVAGLITDLEVFKNGIKDKSLIAIERERKLLGEKYKSPEMASVRDLAKSTMSNLYRPFKEDMSAFIKQHGGEKSLLQWEKANNKLSELIRDVDNGVVKNVINSGEVTPENINRLIFSKKDSEIKTLYKSLTPSGRKNVELAILHKAAQDAITEGSAGTKFLSPDKFINSYKKNVDTLKEFVPKERMERLEGFARLISATNRSAKAGVQTMSGQESTIANSASALGIMGFTGLKGAAAATTMGLTARIYESAAVRNLFIKLTKTKEGSKEESAIISNLNTEIKSISDNFVDTSIPAVSVSDPVNEARSKRIEQQRKALSDKDMRMKQLMGIP